MTAFTLRKATYVRSAVEKALAAIRLDSTLSVPVTLPGDIVQQMVGVYGKKLAEQLAQGDRLENILFGLRLSISKANDQSGITEKVTKRASLERRRKRYEAFANGAIPFNEQIVQAQMAAQLKQLESGSRYGVEQNVHINVPTQQAIDAAKATAMQLAREIHSLDDDMTELNLSTRIDISNDDLDFLRAQAII